MITLLTIVHVIVCVFLIAVVLLQHGKGADMGAAFGGSSRTVFGTDGPLPLLNKITTGSAIVFMITSITLAYHSANISKGSVMKGSSVVAPAPVQTQAQAVPVPTGPVEVPLPSGQAAAPGSGDAQFPGGGAAAPAEQGGMPQTSGGEGSKTQQ